MEPARGSILKGEHAALGDEQHDGSQIDFEDLQENRTLESPKGKSAKGVMFEDEHK